MNQSQTFGSCEDCRFVDQCPCGQYLATSRDTLIFSGVSRLPTTASSQQPPGILLVQVEVERDTRRIVDAVWDALPPLAKD